MNILLISSLYDNTAPSGENIVFFRELELLKKKSNRVSIYTETNRYYKRMGGLGYIIVFFLSVWNPRSRIKLKKILKSQKFDIVHVHNTFPSISLSILHLLMQKNIKTLITLHNYRLFCIKGIPFRNKKTCTECLEKRTPIYGLIHKCYKNSIVAGIPSFLISILFRLLKLDKKKNIMFIALTEFEKQTITKYNLISSKKIVVKPNFVEEFPGNAQIVRDDLILFVGRFSEEKGIYELLREWLAITGRKPKLMLIGAGPFKRNIEKYMKLDDTLLIRNMLPFIEIRQYMSIAKYTIAPSIVLETFGLSIIESFSVGTPVIATNIGSNPQLITDGVNGYLYDPFIVGDGAKVIKSALDPCVDYNKLSMNCYEKYLEKYSPSKNYADLMRIYND